KLGVPSDLDFNGHGSWIGGNIAGVANGTGINGIAPSVKLYSLKISNWCGSAYDSELIDAFLFAANNGIDIVSISFGGYLDRSDPIQNLIYQKYVDVVAYAKTQGTVIVASAGNEHAEIGDGGLVLSHGILTTPGTALTDFYGWYETPGGIPGVVDVSATGRVVEPSKEVCPPGSEGSSTDTAATCKPTSDPHQAAGQGQQDQLAYYSNYGSRIDVAGPGGARKFNLPVWDRGGTPGFPYTGDDGTNDFEDFSTTSNYAAEIPCFTMPEGFPFPQGQCYTAIQGTSMATPHASGALALIISAHPELRGDVDGMVAFLKANARSATNTTQPLSATDTSLSDLTQIACPTGYCHLGGSAIPSSEAYGAGIVDVSVLAS
ncbi:MAG TPA: S8 family serine peptidase, partial [Actinomycetota bacterium]|nr:S8 family serine peptidase [Actinomycetota bacterium]